MDEGKGEVVKVLHVNLQEVDVDVVRALGCLQVFSIEHKVSSLGGEVVSNIDNGDEPIAILIASSSGLIALTTAAKDEFFRIFFFL
jgi:hypothetical protein